MSRSSVEIESLSSLESVTLGDHVKNEACLPCSLRRLRFSLSFNS